MVLIVRTLVRVHELEVLLLDNLDLTSQEVLCIEQHLGIVLQTVADNSVPVIGDELIPVCETLGECTAEDLDIIPLRNLDHGVAHPRPDLWNQVDTIIGDHVHHVIMEST
tara:strand:+ start:1283 stop:1612 length:330 start_codon:yes stop_codon:yes gene_type:complete